jgi:hypothetical protein
VSHLDHRAPGLVERKFNRELSWPILRRILGLLPKSGCSAPAAHPLMATCTSHRTAPVVGQRRKHRHLLGILVRRRASPSPTFSAAEPIR